MKPENIPARLKEYPNWVCHSKDKKPINPKTGRGAKANDPATWSDFETAVAYAEKHGYGVGFEFGQSPFAGVDIDGCIDSKGDASEKALAIVREFNSYTEYSPSGTGLHIIAEVDDDLHLSGGRNNSIPGMKGLEMYTELRYFTVTGEVFNYA
jgi:primase-polymerase (primpol)-like protein